MTSDAQCDPLARQPGELEPAIVRFMDEIRERVKVEVGDNQSVASLRRASRVARTDWSLAGPNMPVVDATIMGSPARLYLPKGHQRAPLLIYMHGGGWVMLDLDTHDRMMRAYAMESGWNVLSLDYPLAPEIQFPQNLDACGDIVEHIIENGDALGVECEKIALGGDSSGANLAVSVELCRRTARRTPISGLLLNYGVFDSDVARPSYKRFGEHPYLLTAERMEFFWENYCISASDRSDPRASPLRADVGLLAQLPPVHFTIAAQDVLADENELFAQKLADAGVNVCQQVYENAAHGFLEAVHRSPTANSALTEGAMWLQKLNE